MLINADIGEQMGDDAVMMPFLDLGNIACGSHAGDAEHMAVTVNLAMKHGVKICAHPGYRDRENFGRVSVDYSRVELTALMDEQVSLLKGICVGQGTVLSGVKPHGALYHDMMRDKGGVVRAVMVEVAKRYEVPLVVQAGSDDIEWGVEVLCEVFADRGYTADGGLMARSEAGALYLEAEQVVEQAEKFIGGGERLLEADTLCFHGDNPASVLALKLLQDRC